MARTASNELILAVGLSVFFLLAGGCGGDPSDGGGSSGGPSNGAENREGLDWRTDYKAFIAKLEDCIQPQKGPGGEVQVVRVDGIDFALDQEVEWSAPFEGLSGQSVKLGVPSPAKIPRLNLGITFWPTLSSVPLWSIAHPGDEVAFTAEMTTPPETTTMVVRHYGEVSRVVNIGLGFDVDLDPSAFQENPPSELEEAVKESELIAKMEAGAGLSESEAEAIAACLRYDHAGLRSLVLTCLGDMGPAAAGAATALVEQLRAGREDVIDVLEKIGPAAQSAIPEIIEVMKTTESLETASTALRALDQIGLQTQFRPSAARFAIKRLFKEAVSDQELVEAALAMDRAAVVEEVTSVIQSERPIPRLALTIAGWIGHDMIPTLKRIVRGNAFILEGDVRSWAVDGVQRRIYWTDGNKIHRFPLGEFQPASEVFIEPATEGRFWIPAIAVDPARDRVLWLESRAEVMVLTGARGDERRQFDVAEFTGAELGHPMLAVDGRTETACVVAGKTFFVSLQDRSVRELGPLPYSPRRLVLDGLSHHLYIHAFSPRSHVRRLSTKDFSSTELEVPPPLGMTFDVRRETLYTISPDPERRESHLLEARDSDGNVTTMAERIGDPNRGHATCSPMVVSPELGAVFWWEYLGKRRKIRFVVAGQKDYSINDRIPVARCLVAMGAAEDAIPELTAFLREPFESDNFKPEFEQVLTGLAEVNPAAQKALETIHSR